MSLPIKENLDRLLSTEMDRADFFKTCAVAILAVIGITGLLSALAGASQPRLDTKPRTGSYGDRSFGG